MSSALTLRPPSCEQETLTKHKPMVATYLDANYDRVRASFCGRSCAPR